MRYRYFIDSRVGDGADSGIDSESSHGHSCLHLVRSLYYSIKKLSSPASIILVSWLDCPLESM